MQWVILTEDKARRLLALLDTSEIAISDALQAFLRTPSDHHAERVVGAIAGLSKERQQELEAALDKQIQEPAVGLFPLTAASATALLRGIDVQNGSEFARLLESFRDDPTPAVSAAINSAIAKMHPRAQERLHATATARA